MKKEQILAVLNQFCENTLMETLRISYVDVGEDFLVAKMPVTPHVHQPDGVLNGGATMALAESVGSPLSILAVDRDKFVVRGLEFSANHLGSIKEGYVNAKATFVHKGRTTHLVQIKVTDATGKLISMCKITNIILPKK